MLSKIQKEYFFLLILFFGMITMLSYKDNGIHWSLWVTALYFPPSVLQHQLFHQNRIYIKVVCKQFVLNKVLMPVSVTATTYHCTCVSVSQLIVNIKYDINSY